MTRKTRRPTDERPATVRGERRAAIRLSITFTAPSVRASRELLDALRFLISSTRLERGCVGCTAWTNADLGMYYMEEWLTEADLRRRVRSDQFTSLLQIVEVARDPRVKFEFISSTRGLEYAAQIRGDFGT